MSNTRRLLTAATAGAGAAAAGVVYAASRPRPHPPEETLPIPPDNLPPARLVTVPGHGEMFFRDTGESRPNEPVILLLHGWMFPADLNWFAVYDELSELGRVLAVDHRGHGRGLRPSKPFRLADVADDVAALLRELDTGPVVAVGYSMGGVITQLLWHRHPDVLRGLVLCATSDTFRTRPRDRWAWRAMSAFQLMLRVFPRRWLERFAFAQARGARVRLTPMIHEDTPAKVKELLPWIIGELSRGSAEDIAEAGRELGRYDGRDWVSDIDVPAAVIVHTRDALVAPDSQRALAARIPDAETFELPIDHDGVAARTDLFAPALVKAIRGVFDADADDA